MDVECREAHRRQVAAHRAAARRPAVPPVLVPHPLDVESPAAGPVGHAAELRWQAEQLREGIVWAVVHDPAKVAAMARERRETLGELEQMEGGAGAHAADGVGAFLTGPLGIVPFGHPLPSA